jgi:hypothetical protein
MSIRDFGVKVSGIFALLLVLAGCGAVMAQKMPADEIIAKHLASIGKSDLIAESKNLMAVGASNFEVLLPSTARAQGRAVFSADGHDMALFSTFNMSDYKQERIGLFGNKVDIGFIIPGRRSMLGTILWTYNKVLDNRIFGGSIFSTWAFLGPKENWGKLETEGKKKVGDREVWVVNYTPKGGLSGGSYIKLYFDTETFHHVRTVCYQKETETGFSNPQTMRGTPSADSFKGVSPSGPWGSEMANNGTTLIEDFEDVRSDLGLMLPHKYTILAVANVASGTAQQKWQFNIEEYRLIKEYPAGWFSFKSGPPQ